jgi:hypothetical protein
MTTTEDTFLDVAAFELLQATHRLKHLHTQTLHLPTLAGWTKDTFTDNTRRRYERLGVNAARLVQQAVELFIRVEMAKGRRGGSDFSDTLGSYLDEVLDGAIVDELKVVKGRR